MINSKAFKEFVTKRCEEILFKDETYQNLSNAILAMEDAFKKTLTPEQIEEYNKIEEEFINSFTYATKLIYIGCLNDIKSIT